MIEVEMEDPAFFFIWGKLSVTTLMELVLWLGMGLFYNGAKLTFSKQRSH